MDLLLHLFYMAVVFAIGFIWGWRERENFASKKVDALLMHIDSSVHERIEESRIDIKIEKHKDVYYAYDKDNNTFMAQGSTKKELEEVLACKYSNKRFFADRDNLKEVGLQ
mgnify:CR=1 FL=1